MFRAALAGYRRQSVFILRRAAKHGVCKPCRSFKPRSGAKLHTLVDCRSRRYLVKENKLVYAEAQNVPQLRLKLFAAGEAVDIKIAKSVVLQYAQNEP